MIRKPMGKSGKISRKAERNRKASPATKAATEPATATSNAEIDRYLIPIVGGISALVIITGALTDQWRGAILTEIQVLIVGAAARWGLRY